MNIDLSASQIIDLRVSYIGNKVNQGKLIMSQNKLEINEQTALCMKQLFTNNLKSVETYSFFHDSGIKYNVVYDIVCALFERKLAIDEASHKLSCYLHDQCTHPNIKPGEFYVVSFKNCMIDSDSVDAIGLFKTESKEPFLIVDCEVGSFKIASRTGININKLDKGCIIFNVDAGEGYVATVVDNTNRLEAQYWIDSFLHIRQREAEYFKTSTVLQVAKNFITKELPQSYCVNKADQSELINRTLQYFKDKEEFDIEEFANEVIEKSDIIESFNKYSSTCFHEVGLNEDETFYISDNAVKKQARSFKSVIKLDKNFHIYVHGDRHMIEQGEDEKGRYYKVYYNEEY